MNDDEKDNSEYSVLIKYLLLLEDLSSPSMNDKSSKEILQKILEDFKDKKDLPLELQENMFYYTSQYLLENISENKQVFFLEIYNNLSSKKCEKFIKKDHINFLIEPLEIFDDEFKMNIKITSLREEYPFDKELFNTFIDSYKRVNQIKLYYHYLLIFPAYVKIFDDIIENILFKVEKSLSLEWKLFLGIMASASVRCEYLMKELIKIFLVNGGEKIWIREGLKCQSLPETLKKFATINNLLAHQPWFINLLNLKDINENKEIVIRGCIIITTFQHIGNIINSFKLSIKTNNSEENDIYSKFISRDYTVYHDFNYNSEDYIFDEEFDWNENGTYVLEKYAKNYIEFLNKEFTYLNELSSIKNEGAISFNCKEILMAYIKLIFGIKSDSFEYKNINKSFKKPFKTVIKKLACFPKEIDEIDLKNLKEQLKKVNNYDETVHLILLISSIRHQISLTYLAKKTSDENKTE